MPLGSPQHRGRCELHRGHYPAPRTFENHHVVPQAWQAFWRPGSGLTGRSADEAERVVRQLASATPEMREAALWDRRTVRCCPTGHRNVHDWLVQLMLAAVRVKTEDPLLAATAVWRGIPSDTTKRTAYTALVRWREAGGSLLALGEAGLYGYA